MKANLLVLTLLTLTTTVSAAEKVFIEDGHNTYVAYMNSEYKNGSTVVADNEKDMKIATLNKLLDQQQRQYERKISYLEEELQKSKVRLVEKSINHEKIQEMAETRFNEEATFLKRELVAKTKTLMEYQRQLEKIKPTEDMKNLIKINTELALEVRRSTDQLAIMQLKGDEVVKPGQERNLERSSGRMPASVGK